MEFNLAYFSLTLNSPLLLTVVIPLVAALLYMRYHRTVKAAIRFGGLDYAVRAGMRPARRKSIYRVSTVVSLVILIGFAWTAPEIRTHRPMFFGPAEELSPVYLVALDVSGSMTEPLGGYVVDGELNLNGPNRFEASRAELYDFAVRYPSANLGLILFSVQPMLVRWPTSQTEYDFHEVLDEGMRFTNPARKRTSQLARFAGGTATRAGLTMARDTLDKQRASSRALILIGDLIDNIDEVIEGVQQIDDSIYVYVIALDAMPDSLTVFNSTFSDKSNIRIFPVKSRDELDSAFDEIDAIEAARQVRQGSLNYVQDIRWLVCLMAFVLAVVMMVLFETGWHKTGRWG